MDTILNARAIMKNILLPLLLLICFISCDNKKKYEGQWTNYFLTNYGYNETKSVIIENDSIKFSYPFFDYWNSYPLKIENNDLSFNNLSFKTSIKKDTLSFNPSIHFVKDEYDTLYRYEPILKINLPEIYSIKNTEDKSKRYNFIYFGKRLDNDEYSLQLNDKYAKLHEIPSFLAYERASIREELIPFFTTVLIIDESTPLKYIEGIFHQLKKINQLKVRLTNRLRLDYNDNQGLYYKYEGLNKKLPYFRENDFYVPKILKTYGSPPPLPPPYFPMFENINQESKFILLKEDKIYFNDSIISSSELKTLIIPWIKNNNAIFTPYSLDSTYKSFLEMNAIINSAYNDVRENQALIKFNKKLNDLTSEELNEIKLKRPMLHVWSYSIHHYNSIVEKESSFFGLKAKSIN